MKERDDVMEKEGTEEEESNGVSRRKRMKREERRG